MELPPQNQDSPKQFNDEFEIVEDEFYEELATPEDDKPAAREYLIAFWEQEYREATQEHGHCPVADNVQKRRFTSLSKGRNKPRPRPKEVTLLGYKGRWIQIRDQTSRNGLDEIAQDLLAGLVGPDNAYHEFIKRFEEL